MPVTLSGIKRWPQPEGSWSGLGIRRRGKWLTMSDIRNATAFIDLDHWPPEAIPNRSEFVSSFDVLPDGKIVVCSMMTDPESEYAIRIHPASWATSPSAGVLEEYPNPARVTLAEVRSVSGRVVAFESIIEQKGPAARHRAYLLNQGKFIVAPGLPKVTSFDRKQYGHQTHVNGKVTLATGEEILIWDGNGYSWNGKRFKLSWELHAQQDGIEGWTSVPWGQDGFFYQSKWKLMYARRGERPVCVHPDAENVFFIEPGPEDSVILCMGRNAKRHLARVWFPAEGTYIPLFRGPLGLGPSASGGALYWNETSRHIHIDPLTTFPDSEILALKRIQPRGRGYQIAKS